MKYAVIADIHGNLEALNAVIARADAERVKKYICAGDIVGYNANPKECLKIVQSLDLVAVVRGNHDEYAGNDDSLNGFNPGAAKALMWTRQQLTDTQRKWLIQLKLKEVMCNEDITVVHATLDHPNVWKYIYDKYNAADNFFHQTTSFCFYGHSHVPVLFKYSASLDDKIFGVNQVKEWGKISDSETTVPVSTDYGCKYLVNVGSVGQPRNWDTRASFAVYDSTSRTLKRISVEYDIEAAQEKIRKAKLPENLALRLEIGN